MKPPVLGPRPSLPIQGHDDRFEVGRILCIGRNYAAHAAEMGADTREPPFHFIKSPTALLPAAPVALLPYPPATRDLHHEVELVVALAAGGAHLSASAARDLVYGYALGLDLTRRDLQAVAKAQARPWSAAKDFDGAAVCGALVPASTLGHPADGPLRLTVNGALRQEGDLAQMIWSVPDVLAHLSTLMALRPGDLIYTGTPSGVGPLVPGDTAVGTFPGLPDLWVRVVEPIP